MYFEKEIDKINQEIKLLENKVEFFLRLRSVVNTRSVLITCQENLDFLHKDLEDCEVGSSKYQFILQRIEYYKLNESELITKIREFYENNFNCSFLISVFDFNSLSCKCADCKRLHSSCPFGKADDEDCLNWCPSYSAFLKFLDFLINKEFEKYKADSDAGDDFDLPF